LFPHEEIITLWKESGSTMGCLQVLVGGNSSLEDRNTFSKHQSKFGPITEYL